MFTAQTAFREISRRSFVLTALLGALLATQLASVDAAPPEPGEPTLRQLEAQLPDVLPWALTHVATEHSTAAELVQPVRTKSEVLAAMRLALKGELPTRNGDSVTASAVAAQTGTTCIFGTNWQPFFPGTVLLEYGSVFVCSPATAITVLDQFGIVSPYSGEIGFIDSNGPDSSFTSTLIHTKVIGWMAYSSDLYCAVGSGTIFWNPPQFWMDAGCHYGFVQ